MDINTHSQLNDPAADWASLGAQAYWSSQVSPRFLLFDRLSLRGSAQELAVTRHAIDDELSALHLIMCSMRTRRNKFSLIGRLPPEILCHIFSFHAINQPVTRDPVYNEGERFPSGPTQIKLSWITVTHVCSHWRQVALSEPNLWSTVVFHLGAEWAEEMLARSKSTLITYCRNLSFRPISRSNRKVRNRHRDEMNQHLSHIQRLVLDGGTKSLPRAVGALTTPAPHLESLELRGHGSPGNPRFYVALPSNIFAYQAPKLRHVTLNRCFVSWDSWFFRDLTYLAICPPAPISDSQLYGLEQAHTRHYLATGPWSPSLDQLLSILEGMPFLEVLILRFCLPQPDSSSRVVPLLHMTKFSLEGPLSGCVAMLEHVSLPGSASLSLSGSAQDSSDGLLSTLISLIAAHFRAARTPTSPLSTLRVHNGILLWDTDVSSNLSVFAPSAPFRLYLSFFHIWDEELIHSFPLQFCRAFPLRDVRTFSTAREGLIEWTPAEWADVSDHCPEVAHLQAGIDWVPMLKCALTERTLFPNLVTLSLVGIDFETPVDPSDGLSESLCIGLRCVRILQCKINYKSLESLRALVQTVEWDSSGCRSDSDTYLDILGPDTDR
ncbi:hypothetical protein BJV78DRAFT_1155064 [Lactifluus subvellereus]|nr:hypothetical protein BJV78DRAFT_1155064 [Lactifluus subvellereus]